MQLKIIRDVAAVYCLNLARRKDRMESFNVTVKEAGLVGSLEPKRIEAVDGKCFPSFKQGVRPTESATCMGHRYIWGLALAHNAPVIVLEDDVTLCRKFSEHLQFEVTLPENCDMLQLGMSWLTLNPGKGLVRTPKSGWGLFAYILFPTGAQKLLQMESKNPLVATDRYSRPGMGLNISIVYPMWACIRNSDSDIAPRASPTQRVGKHFEDDQEQAGMSNGCLTSPKIPPSKEFKHSTLIGIAQSHHLRSFVETGTFYGDTTNALIPYVDKIYTVEIGDDLHARAVKRFRNNAGVTCLKGDSGEILGQMLSLTNQPSLIWLDGHYSGGVTKRGPKETPILEELNHILNDPLNKSHVIVIDDARCFLGNNGYPDLTQFIDWLAIHFAWHTCIVRNDMIFLEPRVSTAV